MLVKGRLPLVAMSLASLMGCIAAASQQLTSYTAPDQSASAGVPPGWKVTQGAQTVITMSGPSGETITLGNTMVVRDGAFQLGQKPANGIDLSMPNSATPAQKFRWIVQQNAAIGGKAAPQLNITSTTPLQLPAALGQCARIVATNGNAPGGAATIAALMCSLPVDSGGTYKVMFKLAQAPTAVAQQESALASAVFASYQIPAAWLQKKLAPHTMPPPSAAAVAGAAAGMSSALAGLAASNNSANCFDLAVIRETPQRLLPRSCGGLAPN